MIFGGIPYYLNLLDSRLSLTQNVDSLIFDERGDLHYEYNQLFKSLFKKPDNHIKIIETIAGNKRGLQRSDLIKKSGDRVKQGEVIALVGRGQDHSLQGSHLHIELWYQGQPLDPEKYILFQ